MFRLIIKETERDHLARALRNTVLMKRANPERMVNKAAQYVASYGIAKIPAANPQRIESVLRMVVHGTKMSRRSIRRNGRRVKINRTSKVQSEWRGTLASVLVAAMNYGAVRGKYSSRWKRLLSKVGKKHDSKPATVSQFYRIVAKFVKSRMRSAGYHKSGMAPALKAFKARASGVRQFKFPPGTAKPAQGGSRRIVASMEDFARAIREIAPNALRKAEGEVASMFDSWLKEDLNKSAKAEGFKLA